MGEERERGLNKSGMVLGSDHAVRSLRLYLHRETDGRSTSM